MKKRCAGEAPKTVKLEAMIVKMTLSTKLTSKIANLRVSFILSVLKENLSRILFTDSMKL